MSKEDHKLVITFRCPSCKEEQKYLCVGKLNRYQPESETVREVLCMGASIGRMPCLQKFSIRKDADHWRAYHNGKRILSDTASL